MKKGIVSLIALAVLAACAPAAPYYDLGNYNTLSWSKKSFDEAKAKCRYENLAHNKVWDTYEIDKVKFKACMEQYGYRYNAPASNWFGSDDKQQAASPSAIPPVSAPVITTEDKSALYR